MDGDAHLQAAAATVRRSVMSLGRRLKLERPADGRTSLELSALGHLLRRGPLTPGEIAAAERVQPQTLTRTLTSLEADGLVSKAAHPRDGRMILLELTEAGRAALRRDMAARDSWLAQAMAASLTATELELLRLAAGLLERVADAAETPADSGARPPESGPAQSGRAPVPVG
jgi:DNA-binding MarR family transcriptional regulator